MNIEKARKSIKAAIYFVEKTTNPDKQLLINTILKEALKYLEE